MPTSLLSLHGLVRDMAEVERNWFGRVLLAVSDRPPIWYDPAIEDSELVPLDDADWEKDLAMWPAECDQSGANAAGKDMAYTGTRRASRSRCAGSTCT